MEAADSLTLIQRRIADYYTVTVQQFGSTPRGVDWTCQATQEVRFVQLLKLCDFTAPVSLNDLGCGYGALAGFVARHYPAAELDYLGVDLSPSMIRRARARCRGAGRRFLVGDRPDRIADYTVASGIMNVRLETEPAVWDQFVAHSLAVMRASSRRGFAVNFLTAHGDAAPGLYRTAPEKWVAFCEQAFGI